MGFDVLQGGFEGGQVDGFEAVPVGEVVVGVERDFGVGFVEVVFVQDEGIGEDVAEEAGDCGFAAGGGAGEAY